MTRKVVALNSSAMVAVSALMIGVSLLPSDRATAADGTPGTDGSSSTQTVTSGAATVTGGDGGNGGNGTFDPNVGGSGGAGGDGGSATLTSSGSIDSANVTAGNGGLGGSGGGGSRAGTGAAGGDGGIATMTNSANVSGTVAVTGGSGALGGAGAPSSTNSGNGAAGGAGGGAAMTNAGAIADPTTVSGGNGGNGGNSGGGPGVFRTTAGAGGAGSSATLSNSGAMGDVTVSGGAGGLGGIGSGASGGSTGGGGGAGADGGIAAMTNTGSAGAVVMRGGAGGAGGNSGQNRVAGQAGAGGSSTLLNSGTMASATVMGGSGGVGGSGGSGGSARPGGFGNLGAAGGDATLSNSGIILGAAVVTAGDGGAGGNGGNGRFAAPGTGSDGGAGGNATLSNRGSILGGVTLTAGIGGLGGMGGTSNITGPAANGTDGANGSATLDVYAGSRIAGAISLNGETRNLNFLGGNHIYTLNSLAGVNITSSGLPFVVSGNQVAIVDATALSQQSTMLADLTSGIFNSIHARLGSSTGSAAFNGSLINIGGMMQLGAGDGMMQLGAVEGEAGQGSSARGFWMDGFGGLSNADAGNGTATSETRLYGGIAGLDGQIAPGVKLGVFGGVARSELDVDFNSQSVDADSTFGGGYAHYSGDGLFARLLLTAGVTEYDSSRFVANNLAAGGLQTATASYDGTFVSPELTLGTTYGLGGFAIEPSVRGRYAHLSVDGFTETGAAGNLTVASRDISVWLGRVQVAFPVSNHNATFAPRVGVEAWASDSDEIAAVLLGQAIGFAPGGDDSQVTGFFGATASVNISDSVSAFLDGEIHAGDDGFERSEGRAGLKINF